MSRRGYYAVPRPSDSAVDLPALRALAPSRVMIQTRLQSA
jgi:hypothetical protein